jgi:uncharacterized protein (DUF1501 family)
MLTRRRVLQGTSTLLGAASLGGLGLPVRRALAGAKGSDLKFIFVVNYGGWDPTRVFATEFDNPFVDMEKGAQLGTVGDLSFVDHADRPAVRSFFEAYGSRSVIFNGVLVPSVAHENCLRISMTGSTAQDRSDWGAILGGVAASRYALPQVVVGAPSFPGEFGTFVTRTGEGGQLQDLISGDFAGWSDVPVAATDSRAEALMDRYLVRRLGAAAEYARPGQEAALREALHLAHQRAMGLKDLEQDIDWSGASTFGGQAAVAVDLLRLGVSRVVSLAFSYYGWDTHVYNDSYQSTNFQTLFSELNTLMASLASTAGSGGGSLLDETVVVVLSEMGRTPQLNSSDGKDHWPYTSTLAVGPGLAGGRVIGGYDDYYYGRTVDPSSGELAEDATSLSADVVGATLLTLADIDSEEFASGITPITGAIA